MTDTIAPGSDNTERPAHRPPHGCHRCDARWSGLRIAHCSACHETFTTPANFDRHRAGSKDRTRRQGECSDPLDCGLLLNDRGQWSMPGKDEGGDD